MFFFLHVILFCSRAKIFRKSGAWHEPVLLAGQEIKMYRRNLVWSICIRRNAYAPFRLRNGTRPSGTKHTHSKFIRLSNKSLKIQTSSNESYKYRYMCAMQEKSQLDIDDMSAL